MTDVAVPSIEYCTTNMTWSERWSSGPRSLGPYGVQVRAVSEVFSFWSNSIVTAYLEPHRAQALAALLSVDIMDHCSRRWHPPYWLDMYIWLRPSRI